MIDQFDIKTDGIRCSIIIPVYNNVNFTKNAISQLMALPSDYEIIIVDNGSSDNTGVMVGEFQEPDAFYDDGEEYARLVYIHSPKNLGFGRGNNKGYKHASGEYIIFLNNDIKVKDNKSDWPEVLIDAAKDGSIVCTEGAVLSKKFEFVKEGKGLEQTDYWYMAGWCVCAKKETFDKLILDHYSDDQTDEIKQGKAWGPWNEKFFLYFEDGDLTWRAKKQGIRIKEESIPVHHIARATGKRYNMFGYFKKSQRIFKEEWKDKYRP
jgi:GT2 family glycosyltransferase